MKFSSEGKSQEQENVVSRADDLPRKALANDLECDDDWAAIGFKVAKLQRLREYVRHKKDCRISPGGPIMEALGDPEKRSCSCGLSELLK